MLVSACCLLKGDPGRQTGSLAWNARVEIDEFKSTAALLEVAALQSVVKLQAHDVVVFL